MMRTGLLALHSRAAAAPLRRRYASWIKPDSLGHRIKQGQEDFESLEAWALQQEEDPAGHLRSGQQELAELMLSWYV
jgi:xylose isomerase